jgi:hypothetical protein
MVDQEVFEGQLKADRFPFPSEGDITLEVPNANYTLGPAMLHVAMQARRRHSSTFSQRADGGALCG